MRNITIREQPIPEDEVQAKKAMNDMASQLRMVCSIYLLAGAV
jgi:hypothetical protein